MVRDDVFSAIFNTVDHDLMEHIFHGLEIAERKKEDLLTSLSAGHHILILGPPGCGKTTLANRIAGILGDIETVEGCPLNCSLEDPSCPWCLEAKDKGTRLQAKTLRGSERVKRVQGGGDLVPEDLIGALNPEIAIQESTHSFAAFAPGKLIRANRGILLIDLIDKLPERVLNTLFYPLEGGDVTIGAFERKIPLDILVIATGSKKVLETLPLGVLEFFDVVTLGYPMDVSGEKRILLENIKRHNGELSQTSVENVVTIVNRTRTHDEVERGVSTRGTIRYSELLSSLHEIKARDDGQDQLRAGAFSSLPHRMKLAPHIDTVGKREQVIEEILDEVLESGSTEEEAIFSKEDMLSLVEEIAREDKFRDPLRYGAFDLLLKRVQRFPESKLAQMVKEMMGSIEELYPEQPAKGDGLTGELLADVEAARKREQRVAKLRAEQQARALAKTINYLEEQRVLEHAGSGWQLSRKGFSFLLEKLAPKVEASYLHGYGKHSTGRKLTVGEGRVVGTRHFRFGDRYRDVSFKDTIREAIRNRRGTVTRDDIMVNTKDIRARMDIVMVLDLSGTMRQLEKLWYAKESAIALSMAAAQYGDRVGVVSFSNLADKVVDITSSPHKLTKHVIELELHENAFTNIGYGILKGTQMFARQQRGRATQHMILISDGDANAPHPSPQKYALRQAARAARKGITISCICISEESTDPELMRRIARIGRGRIYFIGSEGLADAVVEERFAIT